MCYGIPYLVTHSTLFQLAVLICPLVVLVYSLEVLIYQLVVLVYPLVVSVCPLVALHWPFKSQLIVLVVLSVGLFITDGELSLFVILSKDTCPLFYHTSDYNSITVSKNICRLSSFLKCPFALLCFRSVHIFKLGQVVFRI